MPRVWPPCRGAAIVAAAWLLACGPARTQGLDRYFPATGVRVVALRLDEGQARCGLSDADEIHLRVHGALQGRELRALDVMLEPRTARDTLILDLRLRRPPFLPSVNPGGQVELSIPAGTELLVTVGNGGIEARDLDRGARLETVDDNIRVLRCEGRLELITRDGTAWARDVTGVLQAETRDGRIDAAGRLWGVRAVARDGSLDIEAARGSGVPPDPAGRRAWLLRTRGGSIRLRLPREFPGVLAARTGSGELDPGPYPAAAPDSAGGVGAGRVVRALLGLGQGEVRVESESGPITLR